LSHEVVAGGAAFAAFKAFEDHQRKEGKTVNHAFAKELLVGFAGAEIDKLAETKGADYWDRERYVLPLLPCLIFFPCGSCSV